MFIIVKDWPNVLSCNLRENSQLVIECIPKLVQRARRVRTMHKIRNGADSSF